METNRRVEEAAIREVTADYEARGWKVVTKEVEKLGYDLVCRHHSTVHHVEVKSVRGSICSFPITANEKQTAEIDSKFRIFVVTSALDPKRRKLVSFTGRELLDSFEFSVISFMAKPKK